MQNTQLGRKIMILGIFSITKVFLIVEVVVFTWEESRGGGGLTSLFHEEHFGVLFQDYSLGCQLYNLMVVLISGS